MSYLKPENLEVIQNYLQETGPRGQITPEDANKFAAPVNVSFAAKALSDVTDVEAEGGGMEGRRLLQLRISGLMLGELKPPKSTPTGRTFLSPPNMDFDGDVLDELFMEQMLREKAKLLRGLLRSKTKRGPKRRYAYK